MKKIIKKIKNLSKYIIKKTKESFAFYLTGQEISKLEFNGSPFFVIVMPGSLHILDLFLQHVPENIEFVLVFNGFENDELEFARLFLDCYPHVLIKETLIHGQVLDIIIDKFQGHFGIIDFDCFVFDREIYKKIQNIDNDTLVNGIFYYRNEIINIDVPQTYFLFFNSDIIKQLRRKFHVGCSPHKFSQLNRKIIHSLTKIGVSESCLLEDYKNIFDTCGLLIALGISEGYEVNFVEHLLNENKEISEIIHIGGVSRPNYVKGTWQLRGSYFWRRCLEGCNISGLRSNYEKKYGKLRAEELLLKNPNYDKKRLSPSFIRITDEIVKCRSVPKFNLNKST